MISETLQMMTSWQGDIDEISNVYISFYILVAVLVYKNKYFERVFLK